MQFYYFQWFTYLFMEQVLKSYKTKHTPVQARTRAVNPFYYSNVYPYINSFKRLYKPCTALYRLFDLCQYRTFSIVFLVS